MIFRTVSLALMLGLFLPQLQAAPAVSAYRTEVILVAYKKSEEIDHQLWPKTLDTSILMSNSTDANNSKPPLQPLSQNAPLLLTNEAARINQMRDMKVIWHQAWIENLEENGKPILHPVNVHLTDKFDIYLTGNVSVSRNRYLHFNSNLIMQHAKLQKSPAYAENMTDNEESDNDTHIRAAHIELSRKMRSGELHYIDHPMLGVIVKVVPVNAAP